MKTHTRVCTNTSPCELEHTYFCKYCGDEFLTDKETHYRTPSGVNLPLESWPYCTAACCWSDNAISYDSFTQEIDKVSAQIGDQDNNSIPTDQENPE